MQTFSACSSSRTYSSRSNASGVFDIDPHPHYGQTRATLTTRSDDVYEAGDGQLRTVAVSATYTPLRRGSARRTTPAIFSQTRFRYSSYAAFAPAASTER